MSTDRGGGAGTGSGSGGRTIAGGRKCASNGDPPSRSLATGASGGTRGGGPVSSSFNGSSSSSGCGPAKDANGSLLGGAVDAAGMAPNASSNLKGSVERAAG